MDNTIIYLIGFPGTGKLTIAKEIVAQRPSMTLVDNHLINDPIFCLIPEGGPIHELVWKYQGRIWDAVLDTMINVSSEEASFVLTNHLLNNDDYDLTHYNKIKNMADKRQACFVPIRLIIEPKEHKRRITSPGRKERKKLTDPDAPLRFAHQEQVIDIKHENLLDMDVTHKTVSDVATEIVRHTVHKRQNCPRKG